MKLFEKRFKVVEIHANGCTTTTFLRGKIRDVNKDIEMYKRESKEHQMFADGMIVWAK